MNADDPARCPNIWIPRHVRKGRRAFWRRARRAHERLSWLPRCYAKSVVRACGDVRSPTWRDTSKLREIRTRESRGLRRERDRSSLEHVLVAFRGNFVGFAGSSNALVRRHGEYQLRASAAWPLNRFPINRNRRYARVSRLA